MQTLRVFQKGFNYSQDGPGNRLVYHLAGCSLACPWCSNPEGKSGSGGKEYPVETLVKEAIRSVPMYFEGGGVTLTGGEVTEQFGAVRELLAALRQAGISTCIETNGTHPRLPELFPLIDYLIMDIKHYHDGKHRKIIGVSNRTVCENIRRAGLAREQLALRIPMIGGFNAARADAEGFAALLDTLGVKGKATLELLRYHEYGKDKYRALGLTYPMTEEAHITDAVFQEFAGILSAHGIHLITT